jgi:hypothetical protein
MGLSLMRRGLVDQADPVVPGPADPARAVPGPVDLDPVDLDRAVLDPADRGLEGRADLAHIRGPVDLDLVARAALGRAARDRVDPAGLVVPGVPHPADIKDLADLAGLHPADRLGPGLVDLADRVGLGPVDQAGLVVPVDIRGRVVPVDLVGLDLADPVVPVDLDLADPVDPVVPVDRVGLADPAGLVIRADRHLRRTCPAVLSSAVARRWAARGTCRTASAHPITARLLRPHNTDGVGMAGRHPERRRLSGTVRHLPVAGTVRHLPVVGTPRGMAHRAT